MASKQPSQFYKTYLKILRYALWFFGGWPGKIFGEKESLFVRFHRSYVPYQTVAVVYGEIHYLAVSQKNIDFLHIGHVYITAFLTLVTLVRTILPNCKKYELIMKQFISEFHLVNHNIRGAYDENVRELADKFSYYFSWYLLVIMVNAMVLFNVPPIYNSYTMGAFKGETPANVSLELAIFYNFPYFRCLEHFYLSTVLNMYFSYIASATIGSIDMLLSLMVFQIIAHITILKNNIESIPEPTEIVRLRVDVGLEGLGREVTVKLYNEAENRVIRYKLIDIICYHRKIVNFAGDISNFFGPMLAANYLFQLVSGCVVLFLQTSHPNLDTLTQYGPITVLVFGQLIQVSVVFEVVNSVSTKLIESVYGMPWESMDLSNQRSVLFLLSRIQTPIQVTAMVIVPVGVQTMLSIIKTIVQYVAILQSMTTSE